MKTNIIELGKRGASLAGEYKVPPTEPIVASEIGRYIAHLKRIKSIRIDAETASGQQKSVEVYPLLLGNPQVFDLVHALAPFQPMVYAADGGRPVLGMLSPNYDGQGERRLPSIKLIPLRTPYPLTANLGPDPRMATMLAGAVHAEGKGVGGHGLAPGEDAEHRLTIAGAVSVNSSNVALQHKNHGVRQSSSVVTGLTDGRLGNLYTPDSASDFTGFGEPLVFVKGAANAACLYIPKSFLEEPEAYGASEHYIDASRLVYGAGLQALLMRRGQKVIDEISELARQVPRLPQGA